MKKGAIDTAMPKTFNMSKRLSLVKKANNFNAVEHYVNWTCMQKRINEIGSVICNIANSKKKESK